MGISIGGLVAAGEAAATWLGSTVAAGAGAVGSTIASGATALGIGDATAGVIGDLGVGALEGGGVGALAGGITGGWKGALTGAEYGAAGGAVTAGLGDAIGGLSTGASGGAAATPAATSASPIGAAAPGAISSGGAPLDLTSLSAGDPSNVIGASPDLSGGVSPLIGGAPTDALGGAVDPLGGGGAPTGGVAGGGASGGPAAAGNSVLNAFNDPTWGNLGKAAANNAGTLLSGGAMLYDAFGQQQPPQIKQLEKLASAQNKESSALMSYVFSGGLPPGAQEAVNQATQAAEATIKSAYAGYNLSGSTMEAQALASVKEQAASMTFSFADKLLNEGMTMAGMADNLYLDILKAVEGQDANLSSAIASFASAALGGVRLPAGATGG